MLMMIKLSVLLISRITGLWNGNGVRRVANCFSVETDKEVGLISCLTLEILLSTKTEIVSSSAMGLIEE